MTKLPLLRAPVLLAFADPVVFPVAQPYGLLIVQSELTKRGIDSTVVLPFMFSQPYRKIRDAASKTCPKIIGFSFRNLDFAGFSFLDDGEQHFLNQLKQLVRAARPYTEVIALGGSGFSIAPARIMDYVGADIGFVGTSERDFGSFCQRYLAGETSVSKASDGLSSVVLRGNSHSPVLPTVVPSAPAELSPALVEYARLVGGTVPLRTKTGCSLRCTYCVVPLIEELNIRPWADIRQEIEILFAAGLENRVFIADGEFNLPSPKRAIDLCKLIYGDFGSSLKWRCYLEAGYIDAELVGWMEKAGCVGISLTVDSLSTRPRKGFAKGTTPEQAMRGIDLCMQSSVHVGMNVLFGGPGETLASAHETAIRAKAYNQIGADLAVTIGLRVYPNTPFEKIVTIPRFRKHYQACVHVPWLGVFCSPLSRRELAQQIQAILPPSETVNYTNTVDPQTLRFYRTMTRVAERINARRWTEARKLLKTLPSSQAGRPEVELAQIKILNRVS